MIIVHIGIPKSGTTTIQHYLREHDEVLRGLSIDYPFLGDKRHKPTSAHHNLAYELLGKKERLDGKSGSLDDLARRLRETTFDKTILSSEEFSRFSDDQIEQFNKFLSQFDSTIRIVLIIRDLVEFLPSAYSQNVRFGNSINDFDTFFNKRIKNDSWNYYTLAKRWARQFGWNAVQVKVLCSATAAGGDLVGDFLTAADLDPHDTQLRELSKAQRANRSPGWKTLEAIRGFYAKQASLDMNHPLMRKIDLGGKRKAEKTDTKRAQRSFKLAAQSVSFKIGWNDERGRYLTSTQASLCLETYRGWIAQINEHLSDRLPNLPDLEERDFVERLFMPDITHIDPAELMAFYDAWGARLEEA